ncbi:flagellar hook-associated protein flgk [hydrocarbon metagenome]|uniref:Flagellar hook-associated protein flgk n=1 Tax=hydrocarbon metagenome TaxID=938273 RepID=A0A0W8E105_9ZZZZ
MSIMMGLETGKRAITVQQLALQTTGHNIANANTEGYTRQTVGMEAARPFCTPGIPSSSGVGQIGTGVSAGSITRIREEYIDLQIRKENRNSGYWESIQDGMEKIEVIINEPSNTGLRSVMEAFWQSWQDLSVNPESEAVRAVVVERGNALAETFNHMYQQFTDLKTDINSNIRIKVQEMNSIITQLRDLNKEILAISVSGQSPNDLMDKRDLLLDQLSRMADISITEDNYGMVSVQMGGRAIVQGTDCTTLSTSSDPNGMYMVIWADTGIKANISSGELGGLLDLRGQTTLAQENSISEYKEIIPELIDELNTMAKTIVVMTNQIHRGGYSLNNNSDPASGFPDGTNFFSMPDDPDTIDNWASYMKLDGLILSDANNIAAAANRTWDENDQESNFGDGSIALRIAQLKQSINVSSSSTSSESLSGVLAFPSSVAGDLTVNYTGGPSTTITLAAPAEAYQDLQELAAAIQHGLDANNDLSTAGISIKVSCDGDRLIFSSSNSAFEGISDVDLLGGTAFSALNNIGGMIENVTGDDYWASIASGVGVQCQQAARMSENQGILLNQLENERQSVSGVSLDEETADLLKYQAAYNAAARFITVIDEQLDTIINRMGTVGR